MAACILSSSVYFCLCGPQQDQVVPLVAVYVFVFYFCILADDTTPVGLAVFAASAISGGNPIKTGIQRFAYDVRTALLPFLFIDYPDKLAQLTLLADLGAADDGENRLEQAGLIVIMDEEGELWKNRLQVPHFSKPYSCLISTPIR